MDTEREPHYIDRNFWGIGAPEKHAMANTFGTFLDTMHRLESSPRHNREAWPQSEVFSIGKMLLAAGGTTMPVKAVMAKSGLSQESFFGAVLAGRDKGIFEINEQGPEPLIKLPSLGSALIS
jgi:hypothetical protein